MMTDFAQRLQGRVLTESEAREIISIVLMRARGVDSWDIKAILGAMH